MEILSRWQTRTPLAQGMFSLLGTSVPTGILSPYFVPLRENRQTAPSRNIKIFLASMKAIITTFGYSNGSGSYRVSFDLQTGDSSNAPSVVTADFVGTYTFNTSADVYAAIQTEILAYSVANSLGLSASDIVWPVNTASGAPARSESSISLSVQTSTGAVGTQVSTTQDAIVLVDLSAATTASIAGNAAVDLVLEVAPTNSATAGDWVVKGRTGNAQALSLAITLQSIQTVKGQAVAYVPKGYYVKVRSTGSSGTVATSVVEARAILL